MQGLVAVKPFGPVHEYVWSALLGEQSWALAPDSMDFGPVIPQEAAPPVVPPTFTIFAQRSTSAPLTLRMRRYRLLPSA